MIRTKIARTLALAGFSPAGKPNYADFPERFCRTDHTRRGCRSCSSHSPQRAGLLWLVCALAAVGMVPAQAPTASETVLLNFGNGAPKGLDPYAGVIRDSPGNLYGTALGGTANAGLVYSHTTAVERVRHEAEPGWNSD
jgi:hypothetical protein